MKKKKKKNIATHVKVNLSNYTGRRRGRRSEADTVCNLASAKPRDLVVKTEKHSRGAKERERKEKPGGDETDESVG